MDGNSTLSRNFLTLLKKLTNQFSLIKWQKYVFFNLAKLQIWYLRCICWTTFLNLFYCQAYISDTSNECSNNLSTEEDGDCTKFQKLDVQSNVQLTPTSILKENKRAYSGTTTKQQRKKIQKMLWSCLSISKFSMHNLVLMDLWFWY